MKKQLIPGYDPTAGADLEHAAPTAASAGKPLEIEVRATRGGERVFELVVATRRRGELTYKTTTAAPRGDAKWRARITPEPASKPYVLEYFVEARDAGGGAVARIASPDAPLDIALAAGGGDGQARLVRALVCRRWRRRGRGRRHGGGGRGQSRARPRIPAAGIGHGLPVAFTPM